MKIYKHIPTLAIAEKSNKGDYYYSPNKGEYVPAFAVENGNDWVEIKDRPQFEIIEITVGSGIIRKGSPDFDFVICHDHYASHPNNKYNHKIHAVRDNGRNAVYRVGELLFNGEKIKALEPESDKLKITTEVIIF